MEMFRDLTRMLDKEGGSACARFTAFSFLCPAMDIICYSAMIHIINTAVRTQQTSGGLILFTLFMGGISVLKFLVDLYRCRLAGCFIYQNAQKISMKLFEVMIKEDLERHNQKSVSQVLTVIRNDAESGIGIITNFIEILISGITLIGYSLVLIYVTRWIGVGSSILLILAMLGIIYIYQKQAKTYGEKCRTSGIKVNAQISTTYGVFKEMKISDREDLILQRYGNISREYMQAQKEYSYKTGAIGVFMNSSILIVIFFVLALFLVFGGESLSYILGQILAYMTALVRMVTISYGIINKVNRVEFSRNSYEALQKEFGKYEEIKKDETVSADVRQKKIHLEKRLLVKNLSFGYPGKEPIFQDVSLEIPAGKSVAVTGISGAGKTTFLDLVLGLLNPQSGSIYYDDYDIVTQTDRDGACMANIGEIVSYIPQTIYLNGETIRNNVAFFEEEKKVDERKVQEALERAMLWEDVSKMPEGMHTLIGENGTAISGGQRQRVALARALYKNFELLIMDEATTALDMDTEMAVIDSIRQIKGNKTILMVTHHMSLAQECDIIYRIENRKIVRIK